MLASSARKIVQQAGEDRLVLDVGGWGKPFTRADWVLDHMPYESRGLYGRDGEGAERFRADTWVRRDICDREPWPFADGQFDFVVCSHTLEDVRDPVWVCSEIVRVGRAGYVEVPSRLEEQSFGVSGPCVGWSHHRWLIDVTVEGLEFVHKPHVMNGRTSDHFPSGFWEALTPEQRAQTLWWSGGFEARERILMSAEEVDPYLAGFVSRHRSVARRPLRPFTERVRGRLLRAAGRAGGLGR